MSEMNYRKIANMQREDREALFNDYVTLLIKHGASLHPDQGRRDAALAARRWQVIEQYLSEYGKMADELGATQDEVSDMLDNHDVR